MDAASAPAQGVPQPSRPAKKRTGTSKYDFIKVKTFNSKDYLWPLL